STSTAATSRRSNSRLPTTLNARDQPPAEVSDQRVSGLTGAVQLAVSVAVHKPRTDSYSPGGSVHNPRLIPTDPTHTPQSSPPSSTTPTDVDLHQDQTVPKLHTL
ncbi:hypothetical protein C3937_00005, partial [Mycobacterium tuberculosis]